MVVGAVLRPVVVLEAAAVKTSSAASGQRRQRPKQASSRRTRTVERSRSLSRSMRSWLGYAIATLGSAIGLGLKPFHAQ